MVRSMIRRQLEIVNRNIDAMKIGADNDTRSNRDWQDKMRALVARRRDLSKALELANV